MSVSGEQTIEKQQQQLDGEKIALKNEGKLETPVAGESTEKQEKNEKLL